MLIINVLEDDNEDKNEMEDERIHPAHLASILLHSG